MPANRDESISEATRALTEATAALTRLIGTQARHALPDALATGLREVSRNLADASDTVSRQAGSAADDRDDRRRQKVDRTRSDLLDAAARVIAAQGYEGASVGDIAAEAGYTKGAVYAHFKSKEDVFLALARRQLLHTETPEGPLPGLTAAGVDIEVLADWLREAMDDPRLLLELEFIAYGLRHPDTAGELAQVQVRGHELLAEQVATIRRERGDTTPGLLDEDRDTALAIVSVLNVGALQGRLTGSPHMAPEVVARVVARLVG